MLESLDAEENSNTALNLSSVDEAFYILSKWEINWVSFLQWSKLLYPDSIDLIWGIDESKIKQLYTSFQTAFLYLFEGSDLMQKLGHNKIYKLLAKENVIQLKSSVESEKINKKTLSSMLIKSTSIDILKTITIPTSLIISDPFIVWTPPWTESLVAISILIYYINSLKYKAILLLNNLKNIDFTFENKLNDLDTKINERKIKEINDVLIPLNEDEKLSFLIESLSLQDEIFIQRIKTSYKHIKNSIIKFTKKGDDWKK